MIQIRRKNSIHSLKIWKTISKCPESFCKFFSSSRNFYSLFFLRKFSAGIFWVHFSNPWLDSLLMRLQKSQTLFYLIKLHSLETTLFLHDKQFSGMINENKEWAFFLIPKIFFLRLMIIINNGRLRMIFIEKSQFQSEVLGFFLLRWFDFLSIKLKNVSDWMKKPIFGLIWFFCHIDDLQLGLTDE